SHALKRGAIILGLGLMLGYLADGKKGLTEWDVLPLIGVGSIVLYFCRNLSARALFALALGVMALTPVVQRLNHFAAYWGEASPVLLPHGWLVDRAEDFTGQDAVKGFLSNGYFPLFPWLAFVLFGLGFGKEL